MEKIMKIAIASGKGGTGKTTLSVNLALFLSEKHKVVLTDLDVEEPNSGLFLKGEPVNVESKYKMIPKWNPEKCILCGNCQTVCNFHAVLKLGKKIAVFNELCHGCYACSELCPTDSLPMVEERMGELKHFKVENIDFIESRLDIGQEQAVPLISQTFDYLGEKFTDDRVFIFDSPPGTSCPVIEATKEADIVILITEPTPFGLHDLKLAMDTMRQLNKRFAVVINRAGVGDDEVEKYCNEKNVSVIAKIPNDRKIAELYSRGEIIYKKIPEMRVELEKIEKFVFDAEGGEK
jgi:MinD superfamily P-loop ATPase